MSESNLLDWTRQSSVLAVQGPDPSLLKTRTTLEQMDVLNCLFFQCVCGPPLPMANSQVGSQPAGKDACWSVCLKF